jgi:hypothetical protein
MYVIMYVIFRSIIAASAIIRYYAIYHEPPSWSRNAPQQLVQARQQQQKLSCAQENVLLKWIKQLTISGYSPEPVPITANVRLLPQKVAVTAFSCSPRNWLPSYS